MYSLVCDLGILLERSRTVVIRAVSHQIPAVAGSLVGVGYTASHDEQRSKLRV